MFQKPAIFSCHYTVLCRTVCDTDMDAIATFCTLMEQLDILGTREVSPSAVQRYLITIQAQCTAVIVNKRAAIDWRRATDSVKTLKARVHRASNNDCIHTHIPNHFSSYFSRFIWVMH